MQVLKRYWFVLALSGILFILGMSLVVGSIVGSLMNEATPGGRSATSNKPFHLATPILQSTQIVAHNWKAGARLVIPTIGLNAPIEEVGVRSDGNMDVPDHNPWEAVGWYKYGTFPGERGSAVIDGHLDRPGGSPAVFWKLSQLHVGDVIQIMNPGDRTLKFRVKDLEYYRPQDAPLSHIFGDTSGVSLNLVTCAGAWVPAEHQTTLRLVVYTTLEK